MTKRANFKHRIQQRREEAAERQAAYDKLSLDEKIERARQSDPGNTMAPGRHLQRLISQKQAA